MTHTFNTPKLPVRVVISTVYCQGREVACVRTWWGAHEQPVPQAYAPADLDNSI